MSFQCTQCSAAFEQRREKCPACGAWGSLSSWMPLRAVEVREEGPLGWKSGIEALDTLVGGQWVSGCVYRVSGHPACGKSTLALHLANAVPSLYLSCEEQIEAVAHRSRRLGLECAQTFIGRTESAEDIVNIPDGTKLIIVDSLNKLRSSDVGGEPGSNSQLVRATAALRELAEQAKVTVLAIAHINAEGEAAGTLQVDHDIDVILKMERPADGTPGTLAIPTKNRHGPSGVRQTFEMTEKGLVFV